MQPRQMILAATAAILVTGTYYAWGFAAQAGVGAAAMAKVACSCVFVDGRTLGECRADDPPGFDGISVSVDEKAKSVTGTVLGLIRRTAKFNADYGCTLEP